MSATGSAGTIAAGDRLKDTFGTRIVAVEALECPTMLENGFGEHNIQGIGDKHIPLIHNVMNTDVVVGVSDRATDELDVLFNSDAGRAFLADRKGVPADVVDALAHFGFSSTCNVLAAIKTAKLLGLGPDDAIVTVATDGGAMYPSERATLLAERFGGEFTDRRRGRGVRPAPRRRRHRPHDRLHRARPHADLQPRLLHVGRAAGHAVRAVRAAPRARTFWRGLRRYLGVWDEMITEFNARVGVVTVTSSGVAAARVVRRRPSTSPRRTRSAARARRPPTATTSCTRSTVGAGAGAARRPQPVRRLRAAPGVVGVRPGQRDDRGRRAWR